MTALVIAEHDNVSLKPGTLQTITAASQCGAFLDVMAPYVTVITLEALRQEPSMPKQADGQRPYSNLFDGSYKPTPSYYATLQALERSPSLNVTQRPHQ